MRSREPRKESAELVAVLPCARPNRRSRERRVHVGWGFGEMRCAPGVQLHGVARAEADGNGLGRG